MRERLYRRIRAVARALMLVLFPIRASGMEHVPPGGAGMLCINHISLIDPIAVACAMQRPVHFIGKRELFKGRFLAWFLGSLGALPVNRGGSDLAAMRASLQVLKNGGLLGVFPQGHRYKKDDVHELETGAAMLALRSGAPVIPVHIAPGYRLFRRLRVRVGAPVDLSDLGGKVDADAMREVSRRIADAIWAK
ncbi:MAG: 1-acyl-sn-glycerol-3-phosphate acyltransferase [Clostridiales bacterium]|nr:1-acyl-sn-glycerol-3-phosphate acyltransferase [Clostridiales bacterium]